MNTASAKLISFPVLVCATVFAIANGQTLYVPSGTGGIGSSSTGNVGIGTGSPQAKLQIENGSEVIRNNNAGNRVVWQRTDDTQVTGFGSDGYSDLIFLTNNSEKMRITSNGNVGIGTTSPAEKMEVFGGIESSGPTAGYSRLVLRSTATGGQQYEWYNDLAGTGSGVLGLYNRTAGNYPIAFTPTAYVGIGTLSPQDRLHVTSANQTTLRIENTSGNYDNQIRFITPSRDWSIGQNVLNMSPGLFVIRDNSAGDYRLAITTGGNVGIGTTNPTQKLSVNGTIRAKEVIVEASPWPDDVFDESYMLKALSEVEASIKAEGHLPGVPSAATVGEQGVAVGEMQKVLLRKVEELTLYVIDLKKENAELRSRLEKVEQAK